MENRSLKILAVDDNHDNLISLEALLKEIFPEALLLKALNGEIGLKLAAEEDPDVILLDIVMPGMDGFEVCRKLKVDRNLSDIPVVFITAIKGDKEHRIRALECGAEAFLAKPIDECELTAQIRAMLKIKNANREKRDEKERLARLVEEQTRELRKAHSKTLRLLDDLKKENEARKKSEKALIETKDNLEYLSNHDDLTGLYNRRFYEEELIRKDTEKNLPLSIIMADINGLKLINDSFGHAKGDELLMKAAQEIRDGCRSGDIIARLGGDEFVIILPRTDTPTVQQIMKRITDRIINKKVETIDISISFGYETKYQSEEDIQEIIKKAEDNMYRQKLYESSSQRSKTIDLIMNALFAKSNREMSHSKRVSEICETIAISMKLNKEMVNQIKIAGLMHDIGKMGVNEKILNKPHRLTGEEWKEIKRHPEIGYRILSSANEFSEIAGYILEHHERWDGQGYPKGLKGDEISLQARIIAIADACDAMTCYRPYSNGLSEMEARKEIKRCSGTQFDPVITEVFLEKCMGREKSIMDNLA
ncbi:diguanylate cyclase [Dehalobacter sp. DCM]|uniref:HD domain-containing protein n=1 Tax=Dehalobacter sp. DCM TaxID=2907827 RepID=UPI0030818DBE|nr:diguanylate cyclase [Dehalobacter sp. DCM]